MLFCHLPSQNTVILHSVAVEQKYDRGGLAGMRGCEASAYESQELGGGGGKAPGSTALGCRLHFILFVK